jgi:hypothetical protein
MPFEQHGQATPLWECPFEFELAFEDLFGDARVEPEGKHKAQASLILVHAPPADSQSVKDSTLEAPQGRHEARASLTLVTAPPAIPPPPGQGPSKSPSTGSQPYTPTTEEALRKRQLADEPLFERDAEVFGNAGIIHAPEVQPSAPWVNTCIDPALLGNTRDENVLGLSNFGMSTSTQAPLVQTAGFGKRPRDDEPRGLQAVEPKVKRRYRPRARKGIDAPTASGQFIPGSVSGSASTFVVPLGSDARQWGSAPSVCIGLPGPSGLDSDSWPQVAYSSSSAPASLPVTSLGLDVSELAHRASTSNPVSHTIASSLLVHGSSAASGNKKQARKVVPESFLADKSAQQATGMTRQVIEQFASFEALLAQVKEPYRASAVDLQRAIDKKRAQAKTAAAKSRAEMKVKLSSQAELEAENRQMRAAMQQWVARGLIPPNEVSAWLPSGSA